MTGSDILKLVFRPGTFPVAAGLVIGLAVSVAGNLVVRSQLVDVSPADPIALAAALAALGVSGALGYGIPASHAMRVDPALALKQQWD